MPTYEFSCKPCFERGVVSVWEMRFKMDDPKNSFCPACGSKGQQVILTAPMITRGEDHERFKHADTALRKALDEQGVTRVEQKHFGDHIEGLAAAAERSPAPETFGDPKTTGDFRPRWGNASDVLAGASQATAAAQAEGATSGAQVMSKLSKVLPSEMAVHPEDAKRGRVPHKNATRVN